MKKNTISLLCAMAFLLGTSVSFAQQHSAPVARPLGSQKAPIPVSGSANLINNTVPQCPVAAKKVYQDLNVAVVVNSQRITREILSAACLSMEPYNAREFTHPIFYSKDISMFNLYRSTGIDILKLREPGTDLDILSYFLLNPYYTYELGADERELFQKWSKRYQEPINNENLTFKIKPQERTLIIEQLLKKYQAHYTLPRDSLGNSALTYAIQTGEFEAATALIAADSASQSLYKKNLAGLAPVHMVFFMHYLQGDEAQKKEATEKINDMIVSTFTPVKLHYAKYNNMSYIEFAHIFKDRNPDFYNKLQKKLSFVDPVEKSGAKETRKILIEGSESVRLLKQLSLGHKQ